MTRLCAVCGDVSDGPHFGAFACRACAAFFRRTVTLKLEYRCRADSECNIDTLARNMCRSCRFQKCLMVGMVATAVQNTRDGIGKRSSSSSKLYLDKQPRNQNYELGLSAGPFDGHSSEPRSTVNHSSELVIFIS
ncbi:unnamed protein product [Anisakis simplex]|uniref:Nuclear receptor domain-containing protein n=1 Tax=Anisakis simplex TaxID=6269 RepID=A0A0M3J0Q5_ANISI|nr:unnamed protein product [Anisakis simplex]